MPPQATATSCRAAVCIVEESQDNEGDGGPVVRWVVKAPHELLTASRTEVTHDHSVDESVGLGLTVRERAFAIMAEQPNILPADLHQQVSRIITSWSSPHPFC
jgi:hypothetical protein